METKWGKGFDLPTLKEATTGVLVAVVIVGIAWTAYQLWALFITALCGCGA